MKTPGIFQNEGVKGVGGVAALEGINTLSSNFHNVYDASIGDVIGSAKGATDTILDMTGIESALVANPLFAQAGAGLGAMALSNKVLKDFGLESGEGKTFGTKNLLRYGINSAAAVTSFAAGSAALPYLIGGGVTYWAGKHGWKFGKNAFKRVGGTAWGLTGGVLKGALVGGKNSVKAGVKGEQKINPVI